MNTKKKIVIHMTIFAFFVVGLLIGDYIGTKRMEDSVEQIQKTAQEDANEKVEEIQNKILQEQYLAKINLYAQVVSDLREYKKYVLENNETSEIYTYKIDSIINTYIVAGRDLEGYDEIVPYIDTEQLRERGDEYLREYLNEVEKLIDTYSNSYAVNAIIQGILETAEEVHYDLIESAKLFKEMHRLEDKCADNINLWELE